MLRSTRVVGGAVLLSARVSCHRQGNCADFQTLLRRRRRSRRRLKPSQPRESLRRPRQSPERMDLQRRHQGLIRLLLPSSKSLPALHRRKLLRPLPNPNLYRLRPLSRSRFQPPSGVAERFVPNSSLCAIASSSAAAKLVLTRR
jgi:hypothetical protein